MKNYFEEKLLRLGYPQRIVREINNNKELQKEERITERLLNEKTN